jgi:hypothetical protein
LDTTEGKGCKKPLENRKEETVIFFSYRRRALIFHGKSGSELLSGNGTITTKRHHSGYSSFEAEVKRKRKRKLKRKGKRNGE